HRPPRGFLDARGRTRPTTATARSTTPRGTCTAATTRSTPSPSPRNCAAAAIVTTSAASPPSPTLPPPYPPARTPATTPASSATPTYFASSQPRRPDRGVGLRTSGSGRRGDRPCRSPPPPDHQRPAVVASVSARAAD